MLTATQCARDVTGPIKEIPHKRHAKNRRSLKHHTRARPRRSTPAGRSAVQAKIRESEETADRATERKAVSPKQTLRGKGIQLPSTNNHISPATHLAHDFTGPPRAPRRIPVP
ncbi:hypothetical protein PTKU64_69860 [Paraburkholderia terrae]|uniref:Uncharacterized protein n=1 Tax=Paraburkholderia terrae TaxID=311230 RepID=A0ABN6JRC9_9BURK|nr:hypothetical protein PTKU64_69860 [Paraburkholderia terrae]